MNQRELIHKNITFFARYYKLVALAVAITVAVITGSLVTGDSVRNTLVKRVNERLGTTETVLFAMNSFLDEAILGQPILNNARGILLTNGFISQSGQLLPVMIWGTDDLAIERGKVKINAPLAKELSTGNRDIVLRLPATGLVPSGSLFVTENYTTSLRLEYDGIIPTEEGGNISLKNEQILPLNIFVNRRQLAEVLETEGRFNLILSDRKISQEAFEEAWQYSFSGLKTERKDTFTEITSDRVFIQKEVVQLIRNRHQTTNRIFSYLVNSIEKEQEIVPYSFVTAADQYKNIPLPAGEMILSDYAAKRLQAKVNDTLRLTYFTSSDLKTLHTDTIELKVKEIVPLTELVADSTLSAEFPGLSDVERCTDWDSDLPIDMDLITNEDEAYWELYRNTPKAIISYTDIETGWSNPFGAATAIRITEPEPDLNDLTSSMFGLQLIHPREAGLTAARNGVDFSGLFLALGFFIIVSALLLMLVPLTEMLFHRQGEIALLQALGYPDKKIIRNLWIETAPVTLLASLAGVVIGLLYTMLIMWLLGSVWQGATHTQGFQLLPDPATIAIGFIAGILISLIGLRLTLGHTARKKKTSLRSSSHAILYRSVLAIGNTLITGVLIGLNLFLIRSVTLFVIVGLWILITATCWGDLILYLKGSKSSSPDTSMLVWKTLFAQRKQVKISYLTLAIGVFIVFSVGLNRKGFTDSSQLASGTGDYSLWCESSVPVYHNLSTEAGRERLALTSLSSDAELMQCLRYNADEASCLNLNKVMTPSVLGVDMQALEASTIGLKQNIYHADRKELFTQLQQAEEHVYPALVDETVLMWSLGMSLGDTLHYEGNNGKKAVIRLVGTLDNTIFQGHILIDKKLFSEIWEEITGSEVTLLRVPESEKATTRILLSQALHEYGVRVTPTEERLKEFNSVTDTYLTIFMTLGGIGLLLGIMSFIIVVRKNLAMRRKEIEVYRTLGFPDQKIEKALNRENLIVPLYAILTGVISSFIGISAGITHIPTGIWLTAIIFTAFFIGCTVLFVKREVRKEIKRNVETNRYKL